MPQGKRKIPFSGKKKKQQMLAKRDMKSKYQNKKYAKVFSKCDDSDSDNDDVNVDAQCQIESSKIIKRIDAKKITDNNCDETDSSDSDNESQKTNKRFGGKIQNINYQSTKYGKRNANRYALKFFAETDEEIAAIKKDARKSLVAVTPELLEYGSEYFRGYDFPIRPTWSYVMNKERLERSEKSYFEDYIRKLEKFHDEENRQLNFCELNIETWRQLWRVLEMSDIILLIVDIRTSSLMFPPSVYEYVMKQSKHIILVLNKIDLVPAALVFAWKQYFTQKYENINIVLFTSFPSVISADKITKVNNILRHRRRGKLQMAIESAKQIYKCCEQIVGNKVDLSTWKAKIDEEIQLCQNDDIDNFELEYNATHSDDNENETDEYNDNCHSTDDNYTDKNNEHSLYKNNMLTIGCIGVPNVGKSSLMNALKGKKVVSVSKTPGHTKHFQTIFLTQTVRLCDCPGLVFPSAVPKSLQVLMGCYPIAQLRQPFAALKYLAERINLVKLLNLQHINGNTEKWSTMDICEAFAIKRGFYTAKAANPDVHRSANLLLRLALEGKLVMAFRPPNYSKNEDVFLKTYETEIKAIENIQLKEEKPKEGDDLGNLFEDIKHSVSDDEVDLDDNESEIKAIPLEENAFSLLTID